MKINIKPIVSISLFSISLLIVGCNTSKKENNMSKYGEVIMAENLKIIDAIDFYEKKGDLFFVVNLKNNTNETIVIDRTITPFAIYHKDEALEYNLPIVNYPDGRDDQYISLKPNEDKDFEYWISREYQFIEGKHDYILEYVDHFYDSKHIGIVDSKYLTEINFRWRKEKGSDKGTLINTNFDSKIN